MIYRGACVGAAVFAFWTLGRATNLVLALADVLGEKTKSCGSCKYNFVWRGAKDVPHKVLLTSIEVLAFRKGA